MYHEDWLMSQIRLLTAAIAQTVFGREALVYEVHDDMPQAETDDLFRRLILLVQAGRIGEAEDLLFDSLNPTDKKHLLLAVDFYQRLNALSDEALAAGGFSRTEVLEGLTAAEDKFGLRL